MGGLLLFHLEDVISELCLDEIGGLAGSEGKGNFIEFGNGTATIEPSQLSAGSLASRIIGVLARKVSEVRAAFDLLQQIFGFGLCRCIGLAVSTRRNCDQDVTNLDLLLHLELGLMLVVVGLDLSIGDLAVFLREDWKRRRRRIESSVSREWPWHSGPDCL